MPRLARKYGRGAKARPLHALAPASKPRIIVGTFTPAVVTPRQLLVLTTKKLPSDEMSQVPDPIPERGTPQFEGYGYDMFDLHSIESPGTPTPKHITSTTSKTTTTSSHSAEFSPLPPITSLVSSISTKMYLQPTPTITTISSGTLFDPTQSLEAISQTSAPQIHKLTTPLIVLLGVGAGFFLVGVFIILRVCTRPGRRSRPTPSLPILEDAFPDDHFKINESPIFGGKERLSPRPGSNGVPWTWVQYPQPTSKSTHYEQKSSNAVNSPEKRGTIPVQVAPQQPTKFVYHNSKPPIIYPFGGLHNAQAADKTTSDVPHHPPLQQMQSAITRVASRFSVASASVYQDTPQTTPVIGLAISGVGTNFTADGHPVIKRTKSKTLRKSRSNSVLEEKKNRELVSPGLPYEGADVSSPAPVVLATSTTDTDAVGGREGRSRIESSYYTVGSYPRHSRMPSSYKIATATKVNLSGNSVSGRHLNASLRKFESRKDRDTKALTFALGLTSPPTDYLTPSPQPTLYPDDSLSVFETKRPKTSINRLQDGSKTTAEAISLLPFVKPANGKDDVRLMSMEFEANQASASVVALVGDNGYNYQDPKGGAHGTEPEGVTAKGYGRSDDKPPRVPSPPALPSLTQMGLQHANPEGYANYRSPTYSIFGLYGGERMSCMDGER